MKKFFIIFFLSLSIYLQARGNNSPMLSIGFMGDLMLGRSVNEEIAKQKKSYVWGNALKILQEHDLNIVNLETTLTKSNNIVPKVFNFKAHPNVVEVLTEGKIHVVNLANNHILDFNKEGLIETIETLDKAKIKHVGAGKNIDDVRKPQILKIKNVAIGILGYTDNEPGWKASVKNPGTNYVKVGNLKSIKEDIKNLRSKVDILILSIHWGPNMREEPSLEFKDFAHKLIDLGVDILHGHSAHVVQGVEAYKNKLILYDTGDFVDDYMVDQNLRNDFTFIFRVMIKDKKIKSLVLIPCLISNFQVNMATGKESAKIINRMKNLSLKLGTSFKEEMGRLVLEL